MRRKKLKIAANGTSSSVINAAMAASTSFSASVVLPKVAVKRVKERTTMMYQYFFGKETKGKNNKLEIKSLVATDSSGGNSINTNFNKGKLIPHRITEIKANNRCFFDIRVSLLKRLMCDL